MVSGLEQIKEHHNWWWRRESKQPEVKKSSRELGD